MNKQYGIRVTCHDEEYLQHIVREFKLIDKLVPYYDIRTFATFEEFDARFGQKEGNWLSKGEEHKQIVLNGKPCIERITKYVDAYYYMFDYYGEYSVFVKKLVDEVKIINYTICIGITQDSSQELCLELRDYCG